MLDIVGVGDTCVDLIVKVSHLPAHDEKVRGHLLGKYPGGIIGNFCAASAKYGAKTGIITKLGEDAFGDLCKADFVNRNIDIKGIIQLRECDTYFCVIQLDHTGEKALTIIETSGFLPQKDEIDFVYLKDAKYVHMTTLDVRLAAHVFSKVKEYGCHTSLDIEATASIASDEVWTSLLQNVDIAFPNSSGLASLTGTSDIAKGAEFLLASGVKLVVVTCGAEGVRIYGKDFFHSQPAYKVVVKDTTGAGDCFNAVFLSCLSQEMSISDAAKQATAAAAIAIQTIGAREGLPSKAMVDQFIINHEASI